MVRAIVLFAAMELAIQFVADAVKLLEKQENNNNNNN